MAFFDTTVWLILKTFLISMLPIVELRGAVPIAIHDGLNIWVALFVSIIGNLVPVPFIILFARAVFAFIRKYFGKLDGVLTRLEKRAEKKSETVLKYAFWGLFILVAIPLPGTGAWTGAMVAAILDMRLKKALPSITLGVVAAGFLMMGLSIAGKIIL